MIHTFEGAVVAVTGAAGTVGKELVRLLLNEPTAQVRALDNNETGLFGLEHEMNKPGHLAAFLCDISREEGLMRFLDGVDYVFHAAALKHVPLCESSPFEAVRVNVHGMENVIRASLAGGVKKVLFTSSDKAVNPTSVMGTTKLMGERLITAAQNLSSERRPTIFASTRFGNVVGSRGSVLPLFMQQIERGLPITLTHNEMTRFMMTLEEASGLVIDSIRYASGGENFITKMPVMRIRDVAEVMINMMAPYFGRDPRDTEITIIGMRPGEKLYEELSTAEELARMWDCGRYFVVDPLNVVGERTYPSDNPQPTERIYISSTEPAMSHEGIRSFIEAANVLPADYSPAPTPRVAPG